MEVVAAIDQGTQSTRVFLFDANENVIAFHQVDLPQLYPHPGCAANLLVMFCRILHNSNVLHVRWCEQDPTEIWRTVQECIEQAVKVFALRSQYFPHLPDRVRILSFVQLGEASVGALTVVALGITNQRETTILWDKTTGKPLHNAIVWLDNRTRWVVWCALALYAEAWPH
jgi:glycerol kinase